MAKCEKEVVYLSEVPTVTIVAGVVHVIRYTGTGKVTRAMSIKTLQKFRDRVDRALERYASGEQDVIVDD